MDLTEFSLTSDLNGVKCEDCKTKITGNDSFTNPYQCLCGEYDWNHDKYEWELVNFGHVENSLD